MFLAIKLALKRSKKENIRKPKLDNILTLTFTYNPKGRATSERNSCKFMQSDDSTHPIKRRLYNDSRWHGTRASHSYIRKVYRQSFIMSKSYTEAL